MRRFLVLALAGGLLAGPLALAAMADEIPLDQVPGAVRSVIQQEVGDGVIEEIERDVEGGQTVYEVEFKRGGIEQEIKIDEQGRVLKRYR